MLDLLEEFVSSLNTNPLGSRIAAVFNGAIQLRWVSERVDEKEMAWFGSPKGTWAVIQTENGTLRLAAGDHRHAYHWRSCVLIETDEETLRAVLLGQVRPLDAFLADRLHVSHFTIGGAMGQWALALLAFGQRAQAASGLLPGRREKHFMSYPYYSVVDARRAGLLARVGGRYA